MAILNQPTSCSLKLRYQSGVNASGDPVFVNRTYTKAKVTAVDQDLYDVATAINTLQSTALLNVFRVEDAELINQ